MRAGDMSNPRALGAEIREALGRVVAALATGRRPDPEDFVTITGSTAQLQDLADEAAREFELSSVQVAQEQWEANGAKSGGAGDDWRCMVCNRSVNPDRAVWVHMTTQGTLVPIDGPEVEGHPDSQGMQPIGRDCARKIPRAYRAS